MRLIDVEELKKCIKQVKEFLAENLLDMPMKQEVLETVDAFVGLVESMPTVDAEPVRYGKWKYSKVVDDGFWTCSACGDVSEASGANRLYKYCPFCGAKMDGEGNG